MRQPSVTARERMALSLLVEPGDPRLPELLAEHEPGRIVAAIRAGRPLPGHQVPSVWRDRAVDLDARQEQSVQRAADDGLPTDHFMKLPLVNCTCRAPLACALTTPLTSAW